VGLVLEASNAVLVLVDVQGKLAQAMYAREQLFQNLQRMLKGAQVLGIPILWLEQNPRGLGPTVPEIAALLPDAQPMSKFCFSCCGCSAFMQALEATQRRQVLLVGIETHVCVYQTAADLLARGYHVEVVADAVSSRSAENRQIGLERMRALGVGITSTEMALFELLKVAEGPQFKAILSLVR
jgi:nicotinamidase-related amidase